MFAVVLFQSIPYSSSNNNNNQQQQSSSSCDTLLEYETITDRACFLQRIELFYPPTNTDEECSSNTNKEQDCPVCHDCPLLRIGDTFGPLEVVGFGHCLTGGGGTGGQECVGCDRPDHKECGTCTMNCQTLSNCDESIDCTTGESLGIPDFIDNECSFCQSNDSQ